MKCFPIFSVAFSGIATAANVLDLLSFFVLLVVVHRQELLDPFLVLLHGLLLALG